MGRGFAGISEERGNTSRVQNTYRTMLALAVASVAVTSSRARSKREEDRVSSEKYGCPRAKRRMQSRCTLRQHTQIAAKAALFDSNQMPRAMRCSRPHVPATDRPCSRSPQVSAISTQRTAALNACYRAKRAPTRRKHFADNRNSLPLVSVSVTSAAAETASSVLLGNKKRSGDESTFVYGVCSYFCRSTASPARLSRSIDRRNGTFGFCSCKCGGERRSDNEHHHEQCPQGEAPRRRSDERRRQHDLRGADMILVHAKKRTEIESFARAWRGQELQPSFRSAARNAPSNVPERPEHGLFARARFGTLS